MAFEIKNNTGSIFKNDKKEKDTQPDMTGQALINGVPHWVSAWKRTSQGGVDYIAFEVTKKEVKNDE